MGSAVDAHCECGYEAGSSIGGGMMDFEKHCAFPALCRKCSALVQVDLLDEHVVCPKCKSAEVVPYDDDSLRKRKGRQVVASWNMEERLGRVLELTDGEYLCPACGGFTLRFSDAGVCFD